LTQSGELPYVDEHATSIAAGIDDVWPSLLETLDESFSRSRVARYARLVGCVDGAASGPRPLAQGSTIPGFRVVAVDPGRELVLQGHHRFSSYALIFRLEHGAAGQPRLRAESRATFPGFWGGVYRLVVISSGGHVRAVRSMLAVVRRDAERRT
jgi:hypothetical protein